MRQTLLFVVAFCLAIMPAVMAQDVEDTKDSEADKAYQDGPFIEKAFSLKYADARRDAYNQIRLLLSPMGRAIPDERSNSILVRDTPNILQKVSELITRIDVPSHRLRLAVFAVKAKKGGAMNIPANLAGDVRASLEEVSKLLSYSSYELIDSGLVTLSSTGDAAQLSLSENLRFTCEYRYNSQGRYLSADGVRMEYRPDNGNARLLFQSDIGIGDGEVVVAGVSKLNGGDEAILTILTLQVEVPKTR